MVNTAFAREFATLSCKLGYNCLIYHLPPGFLLVCTSLHHVCPEQIFGVNLSSRIFRAVLIEHARRSFRSVLK